MASKAATFLFRRKELERLEEKFSRLLKFCNTRSLKEGIYIHSPIIKLGIEDNLELSNNLLSLSAKCEKIDNARNLFDEIPQRDVVSWTTMISAYTKSQYHDLALQLFSEMVVSGTYPNEFTFSTVLRSCACLGELGYGACIHSSVIKSGFGSYPVSCNSLIHFYSKCDHTDEAYELFRRMENGDTVTWTTMISSLVQAEKCGEALELYADMIKAKVSPNEFTFAKLLGASPSLGLDFGKLLHSHVILRGVKLNVVVKNALIDLYSLFGKTSDAIKVFNLTPEYDVCLWTAVISGFVRNLECQEAIDVFINMQVSGFEPNSYTYSIMLSLCSSFQSLDMGKQIHSRAIIVGLENYVNVGNALLDMYMKCSETPEDALRLFGGMDSTNVISWTAIISGLADHGLVQECFELLREMLAQGVQPNTVTLSCILRACSQGISVKQILLELHGYILRTKANEELIVVNPLANAYASSGMVDDAWHLVNLMDHRDIVTYTGLLTCFNEIGHHEMALSVMSRMCADGINIDLFSLVGLLSASANLGALETGKHLQCYSIKSGLSSWAAVLNGLVGLYGKCGCIEDAVTAFNERTQPDVWSWNSLIYSLASNWYISSALSAFDDMRLDGIKPNSMTFSLLLYACSHGGLVELGFKYFRSMRQIHNIEPRIDHYVYMVDLLGRAGRLEEAVGIIETMVCKPTVLIFKTLLNACRFHRNLPLGEIMAMRGVELDPFDPACYILLAGLYDDCGKSELAEETRRLMRERGLKKKNGKSSVEIHGRVHNFIDGDLTSIETDQAIQKKLESLAITLKSLEFACRDERNPAS